MMNINHDNIEKYLDRFFEGETTREEELALSRYFKENDTFPGKISDYKPMFDWIDKGMPEISPKKSKRNINAIFKWTASVAAAIVVFVLALFYTTDQEPEKDPELLYAGSYICNYNGLNSDIKSILPEIRAIIDEVDEMEAQLDILDFDNEAFAISL